MKNFVNIARICGTHHLKGAIKAFSYFEDIELLKNQKVMVENNIGEKKILTIENIERMSIEKIIIKFEEINHIDEAKKLLNYKIIVRRDILGELNEENFFLFDLIDMDVYTVDNEYIGKISNIMSSAAHDIYIITNENEEIMVPAVDEFIKNIDFNENKIVVKLIEGMR